MNRGGTMSERNPQKKSSSMIQRCVTGAVLVALLACVLFVGSWLFALAAFLCLSLALHEELTAISRGGHHPVWWTSFAGLTISVPLMMFYSSLVIIPILALLSFAVLLVVMRREDPDLGSILCAVVAGRLFTLCFPDFSGFPPIWGDMLCGLFGGIAGQMGDLFASMVKRHCKIKDFGHIFPGHGGMMDRLDSILFTAIIVYSYRVILLASI